MGEEIFIDANIFLEIFLDDEKADACIDFLSSLAADGHSRVITDFILYACLIQIERNFSSSKKIKEATLFFNSLANFRILRPKYEEINDAIKIMDSYGLDFDDSFVVACMKTNRIKKLASLDRHFDKVKWIERIKF